MDKMCVNISPITYNDIYHEYERRYSITIDSDIKVFFDFNNGGVPTKNKFIIKNQEFEIRCFMSFNDNEYNSIEKPFDFFQKNTKGKVYPIAKDSGDNYYCINVENKKIYYWSVDDNEYYFLADSFSEFLSYLK